MVSSTIGTAWGWVAAAFDSCRQVRGPGAHLADIPSVFYLIAAAVVPATTASTTVLTTATAALAF